MPKKIGGLGLRTVDDTENMQFEVQVVQGSGDDAKVIDRQVYKVGDIHGELIDRVTIYGAKKLAMDRTSDVTDKREKLLAMVHVFEQLGKGQWEKDRVMGPATVSAEVEALAKLKGYTIPQTQRALKKYDKAGRVKILGNKKVVKLAEEIKAKRATDETEVSFDDLVE